MSDAPDRRRLNRAVPWSHPETGVYSTADSMHTARKIASHKWERGIRQPYHIDGQYDPTPQVFPRLRDAQGTVESEEANRPRINTMRTTFHDRRGL